MVSNKGDDCSGVSSESDVDLQTEHSQCITLCSPACDKKKVAGPPMDNSLLSMHPMAKEEQGMQ